MVLPALPAIGSTVLSGGLLVGGARAAPSLLGRAGGFLRNAGSRLTGFFGSSAGTGFLGGYSVSWLADELGIEDNRIALILYAGLALAAVYAVGQLFDIQIG